MKTTQLGYWSCCLLSWLINTFIIFSLSTDRSPCRIYITYGTLREHPNGWEVEGHATLSWTRGRWLCCPLEMTFYKTGIVLWESPGLELQAYSAGVIHSICRGQLLISSQWTSLPFLSRVAASVGSKSTMSVTKFYRWRNGWIDDNINYKRIDPGIDPLMTG